MTRFEIVAKSLKSDSILALLSTAAHQALTPAQISCSAIHQLLEGIVLRYVSIQVGSLFLIALSHCEDHAPAPVHTEPKSFTARATPFLFRLLRFHRRLRLDARKDRKTDPRGIPRRKTTIEEGGLQETSHAPRFQPRSQTFLSFKYLSAD